MNDLIGLNRKYFGLNHLLLFALWGQCRGVRLIQAKHTVHSHEYSRWNRNNSDLVEWKHGNNRSCRLFLALPLGIGGCRKTRRNTQLRGASIEHHQHKNSNKLPRVPRIIGNSLPPVLLLLRRGCKTLKKRKHATTHTSSMLHTQPLTTGKLKIRPPMSVRQPPKSHR